MISAADHGLKAWSFSPTELDDTGATMIDGDIHLVGMPIRFATRLSTVYAAVTTLGATIANCFAGLYSEAGVRLGVTADQAVPWTSTGLKAMALTAPVDVEADWLYAAFLMGSGSTDVILACGGAAGGPTVHNANMAAPRLRTSVIAGSATALPTTIDTSALVVTNALNIWAAVK